MKYKTIYANIISYITNIILTAFLLLPIVRIITGNTFWLYLYIALSIITIIFSLIINYKYRISKFIIKYRYFIIISFLCIIISLFNCIRYNNYSILLFSCLFIISPLLSYIILKLKYLNLLFISRLILISYILIIITFMLRKGATPDDFNHYFPGNSRNTVSEIQFFCQILYSCCFLKKHGRLPILSAVITFAISILTFGRSGILLSGILLCYTIFSNILSVKSSQLKILLMIAIIFLILILLKNYYIDIINYLVLNTNFNSGLETSRLAIYKSYIGNLNFSDIIIGEDFRKSELILEYNSNPHNSFIRGHSYFGITYIIWLIYLIDILIKNNADYKFTFLIMLIFARGFFDTSILPGFFDYIIYLLILDNINKDITL